MSSVNPYSFGCDAKSFCCALEITPKQFLTEEESFLWYYHKAVNEIVKIFGVKYFLGIPYMRNTIISKQDLKNAVDEISVIEIDFDKFFKKMSDGVYVRSFMLDFLSYFIFLIFPMFIPNCIKITKLDSFDNEEDLYSIKLVNPVFL